MVLGKSTPRSLVQYLDIAGSTLQGMDYLNVKWCMSPDGMASALSRQSAMAQKCDTPVILVQLGECSVHNLPCACSHPNPTC